MQKFAHLLDALTHDSSDDAQKRHVQNYFCSSAQEDCGVALAVLLGEIKLPRMPNRELEDLALSAIDPELFRLSADHVGNLVETISLAWPHDGNRPPAPSLAETVEEIKTLSKLTRDQWVAAKLTSSTAEVRWLILKFLTGGAPSSVSPITVKRALAEMKGVEIAQLERARRADQTPYASFFVWLLDDGADPASDTEPPFHPLATTLPLKDTELKFEDLNEYQVEWQWRGVRALLARKAAVVNLFNKHGEDLSAQFPEICDALTAEGALDGVIIPAPSRPKVAPDAIERRAALAAATPKAIRDAPAIFMAVDCLSVEGTPLLSKPLEWRRHAMQVLLEELDGPWIKTSGLLTVTDWKSLEKHLARPPHPYIDGVILKSFGQRYPAVGETMWRVLKRPPTTVDAVLLYGERGGRRGSTEFTYTFGAWAGDELAPICKIQVQQNNPVVERIEKFIKDTLQNRFGPVREAIHTKADGLVCALEYRRITRAPRRKAGLLIEDAQIVEIVDAATPSGGVRVSDLEKILG